MRPIWGYFLTSRILSAFLVPGTRYSCTNKIREFEFFVVFILCT